MGKEPANLSALAPVGLAERLRTGIMRAGGGTAVSKASGVPLSTINEYLKGNEARFSKLAAVARASGLSLDWLAWGDGDSAPLPDIEFLKPYNLEAPAHFWGLFVILRSCQEYNEAMGLKPSLAEVLDWIGSAYLKARELPDKRIDFKPPEDIA